MNILVVESEIETAEILNRMIEHHGHQCKIVCTGRDAINKTKQNIFDLVLLDIWLPDIKGYDLIPEFKQHIPDIKIIAMTGLNDRDLEIKIRRQGVIYYLIKPLELYQLKEILDHMWKKLRQETFTHHIILTDTDKKKRLQRNYP